jgi:hypothetical protein
MGYYPFPKEHCGASAPLFLLAKTNVVIYGNLEKYEKESSHNLLGIDVALPTFVG